MMETPNPISLEYLHEPFVTTPSIVSTAHHRSFMNGGMPMQFIASIDREKNHSTVALYDCVRWPAPWTCLSVELQNGEGDPQPDHTLADCDIIISEKVSELNGLQSTPERVQFMMNDPDLY